MPSCAVQVVNQKTGVTNNTTSNEVGFYSVPGLFAGSYTITFTAADVKRLLNLPSTGAVESGA